MTNKEEFYYNKWIEQLAKNKNLKFEIERLTKIKDYNSNFKDRMEFLERENKRFKIALKKLKLRLKRAELEKEKFKQKSALNQKEEV